LECYYSWYIRNCFDFGFEVQDGLARIFFYIKLHDIDYDIELGRICQVRYDWVLNINKKDETSYKSTLWEDWKEMMMCVIF